MLTNLELEGFKAYGDGVIPLRPFTVLIGPNGAGKTTLMEALDLLSGLVVGSIADLLEVKRWEYSDLSHLRSATKALSITATLQFHKRVIVWELGLGPRRRPGISHERVTVFPKGSDGNRDDGRVVLDRDGRRMSRTDEAGITDKITQTLTRSWLSAVTDDDEERFPWLVAVASWARAIRGLHFLDPNKLQSASPREDQDLSVNGENLASFLYRLHKKDRAVFSRVQERVKRHYPRLVGILPKADRRGWTHLDITERWNGETATFNARQVSSGLLRLITIAAICEIPNPPSVLLLDEIENGLHPRLLEGFVRMLQELVQRKATQVILATHSPITVNLCEPQDVILVTRGSQGPPTCVPLSSTRSLGRLAEQFGAGELWYNIGEDKLTR